MSLVPDAELPRPLGFLSDGVKGALFAIHSFQPYLSICQLTDSIVSEGQQREKGRNRS